MNNKKFTFIDLFAGIGGFKIALSSNGGTCIGFSEIDKDAISAYCENHDFDQDSNLGDITKIEKLPNCDLVTAGVPCQTWSIAGKNLGFEDDRGKLWNDTIFLLDQSKPKAFIYENVKGLGDPRHKKALDYILRRIKEAGYYADFHKIDSHRYGVAQSRKRIYIIGFRDKKFYDKFKLPEPVEKRVNLTDILDMKGSKTPQGDGYVDYFSVGEASWKKPKGQRGLSSTNGFNDFFLFNDIRNGPTTIHSWDLMETTGRQKEICLTLLTNRRKKDFGPLDGNPLSLTQLQTIDSSVTQDELDNLVDMEILKKVDYRYERTSDFQETDLTEDEIELVKTAEMEQPLESSKYLIPDYLKKPLKSKGISVKDTIDSLIGKRFIKCIEERFEFKNTKIGTGLNGIYRVWMPTSDIFPTIVASDTNDHISLKSVEPPKDHEHYKKQFMEKVFNPENYRKITKEEACLLQGFPKDFKLPESRARWMKLIGNSVSIPVIEALTKSIIATGVFEEHQ